MRSEVDVLLRHHSVVQIDLADVEAVSPSFADELFAKIGELAGGKAVSFANLSTHLEAVARMARENRRHVSS